MRQLLILLFVATSGYAQQVTERVFYDSSWNKTDSGHAEFFKTIYYSDTSKKAATVKVWLRNGTAKSVVTYSDLNTSKRNGQELIYYPNGQLKSQCMYVEGNLDGEVLTWYPSGQLKRKDQFKKDSLISGQCFTSTGKDTAHFDYQVLAAYNGGRPEMVKFISRNMRYPKSAIKLEIEGNVIIQFIVDDNGSVLEERIISKTHPLINEEALRVFGLMKGQFTAARLDGESVKAYMWLPVMFKLTAN